MIEYADLELEKFGVADENGEIVVDRTLLKKDIIKRGVSILVQQESLKEQLKDLLEEAKEKQYDKKELTALIKHSFKNEIMEKIAELEEIQTTLDNLFGGESED